MTFSLPEKIVFLVALVASVYGFWVRFGKVVETHPRGEAGSGFFDSSASESACGISSGKCCCQAKVIRERPLPGLAHAFVFWGFCIFGLITLNHFAMALGFPILDNMFGDAYKNSRRRSASLSRFRFSACSCGAFSCGPRWLGELSKESGVIAFLIFVLMVTFILAAVYPAVRKAAVVGAHAGAAGVSAADSAHQASAPGAESGHDISFARRLQPDSAAGRATTISGSIPARI